MGRTKIMKSDIQTAEFIREESISQNYCLMGRARLSFPIKVSIKAIGKWEKCMEGVSFSGQMAHHMKVNIYLERNTGRGGLFLLPVITILGTGSMENNMEKGFFTIKTQRNSKMAIGIQGLLKASKDNIDVVYSNISMIRLNNFKIFEECLGFLSQGTQIYRTTHLFWLCRTEICGSVPRPSQFLVI